MNRLDVQTLQSMRGYPALSILLPTHRTSPDNRQDPIRVRNLVKQATDRLLAEFSRHDLQPLLARLEGLVGEIDYRHMLDGLALFVNKDFTRAFYLPFTVKERVVVDETFATRDLVFALNRTPRYWVLALSEKPTRLFGGLADSLMEVTTQGFPMVEEATARLKRPPSGRGFEKTKIADEYQRKFLRKVDAAFGKVAAGDLLPLVVAGVDSTLSTFSRVSTHKKLIISTLPGNYDATSAGELARLVWPLVQANLDRQRDESLQALDVAVRTQNYASGLGEVWRVVQEGRGATLLVEEGFQAAARLDASGLQLTPADDPTAPDVIDDAVDELIEAALAKGGRVVFVGDGALLAHQRVAVILRY